MSVRFVAAGNAAIVRFVRRVHMRVFLPIGGIRKSSITAFEFTFERFLTWKLEQQKKHTVSLACRLASRVPSNRENVKTINYNRAVLRGTKCPKQKK